MLGGKPLTGYNLLMFAATLVAFHLPFAFGAPWTAARELALLAAWVAWSALWDFLWFLLNPAYGWRRFRPGNVWWHSRWLWRLPLDYWVAVVASLLLALAAQLVGGGNRPQMQPRRPARSRPDRWRRRRCCSPPSQSGLCSPVCCPRRTAGSMCARTRPPSTSAPACPSRPRPKRLGRRKRLRVRLRERPLRLRERPIRLRATGGRSGQWVAPAAGSPPEP